MQKRLAGKVALVLGASNRGNMGQAIARRFADGGARVVIAGRGEAELERVSGEIDGAYRACDITSRPDLDRLVAFALDRSAGWT